jgi:hypothetical protein
VSRLTEAERRDSSVEPGKSWGTWRVVYSCPDEGMIELINGTVHASVTWALRPADSGSTLYVAFHAQEVNWTTRPYIALITPFRRYLIYPLLFAEFEHTWERAHGSP